jgi:divalent metal cation (Fe/Co/Zn/Cd) transporter
MSTSSEPQACACAPAGPDRGPALEHALRLEWLTVGWNVVEGVVAIAAALAAGSVALLAFGLDSVVETVSAFVLVWRLAAERQAARSGAALDRAAIERLDRRAHRGVGASLFLLAAWVVGDALWTLARRERPQPSLPGMLVTGISLVVMVALARAKRRTAARLGSRALEADSFQTTACWWLSLVTLGGLALNAGLGWWWADPVAALAVTGFLVTEGREAWRGKDCGCH